LMRHGTRCRPSVFQHTGGDSPTPPTPPKTAACVPMSSFAVPNHHVDKGAAAAAAAGPTYAGRPGPSPDRSLACCSPPAEIAGPRSTADPPTPAKHEHNTARARARARARHTAGSKGIYINI
jgi:hypothetical protein